MKIGIVTIYEPTTNLGSFLQAYAMKTILEKLGHDVYLIEKTTKMQSIKQCAFKINPKREFFLRIIKAGRFVQAVKKFKLIPKKRMHEQKFDCLIYGSDEIWNLENPYFRDEMFWGNSVKNIPKIGYAVSMGAMENDLLEEYPQCIEGMLSFDSILVRDTHTKSIVKKYINDYVSLVCDPTFLIPIEEMTEWIQLPKKPYIFVYTYGVDSKVEALIKEFARRENLMIISACFWHLWVDKVIECSPLQFSSLIRGAKYVFTTTFHGAVFTLLNHKKCCILPMRDKVRDIVERLHETTHLIDENCSIEKFTEVMHIEFDSQAFEQRVTLYRDDSFKLLKGAIECLGE